MSNTQFMTQVGLVAEMASLGLGLYLLLLYRKQKRRTEQMWLQMKRLTEENDALLERVRNTVQPHFISLGVSLNESINRIDITLQNMGAAAIVHKVVTSTPDIEFLDDRFFPLRIEAKDLFAITGIAKEMSLAKCRYVVQLHYSDLHGTQYMTAIRGEGQNYKMATEEKGEARFSKSLL